MSQENNNRLPVLNGFDHIHVYVSDRERAAQWYEDVLGFTVNKTLLVWAKDQQGPLTVEDEAGRIHLALFKSVDFVPSTAVAFNADAAEFLRWKAILENQSILLRFADHKIAWSLYFKDLDGNMYEITTYEYEHVSSHLS